MNESCPKYPSLSFKFSFPLTFPPASRTHWLIFSVSLYQDLFVCFLHFYDLSTPPRCRADGLRVWEVWKRVFVFLFLVLGCVFSLMCSVFLIFTVQHVIPFCCLFVLFFPSLSLFAFFYIDIPLLSFDMKCSFFMFLFYTCVGPSLRSLCSIWRAEGNIWSICNAERLGSYHGEECICSLALFCSLALLIEVDWLDLCALCSLIRRYRWQLLTSIIPMAHLLVSGHFHRVKLLTCFWNSQHCVSLSYPFFIFRLIVIL